MDIYLQPIEKKQTLELPMRYLLLPTVDRYIKTLQREADHSVTTMLLAANYSSKAA